jgi:hypothetical protein
MVKRSAVPTAKAIAFFYKNVGLAERLLNRRTGTSDDRRRLAKAIARAEAEASAMGWRVEWEGDPDGDRHEGAVLRDEHGHALTSLWGVVAPSREEKRVVGGVLMHGYTIGYGGFFS